MLYLYYATKMTREPFGKQPCHFYTSTKYSFETGCEYNSKLGGKEWKGIGRKGAKRGERGGVRQHNYVIASYKSSIENTSL